MSHYVGLDVSLKITHLCVVDRDGRVLARAREGTQPGLLATAIRRLAPQAERVVLETGGQSSWLHQGLVAEGVPAVIVDARRAHAALKVQMNKTDANDAEGLAQLARTGWYAAVAAKRPETRRLRALLAARQLLAAQRREIENQARALLRGFGLAVGRVSRRGFEERVGTLVAAEPDLIPALEPLLAARRGLLAQIDMLDKRLKAAARRSETAIRMMSVPGVGPMTALAVMTALDDPTRFSKSASVGAYLGLTPRRHQSGESGWTGRISKRGDPLARHMLYEAANSLMVRVRAPSPLKSWALTLARKAGPKKARVALARKLAVILHRLWIDGTTFGAATA